MKSRSARLPITRDLTRAHAISLMIAVLMAAVSIAGLLFGSSELYGDDASIVQWFRGWDAANLIVGLPILLGSLWFARRGSLMGLLLWPGALFYVLYTYALYVIGAPFNVLFLAYVALVTLSAYTTIGIVASIDGAAVRDRLAGNPARLVGGALAAIGVLATLALTIPIITTLAGSTPVDPLLHAEWIVDYLFGNPVLLIGGVLLWRRERLGYAVAGGVLFLSGANGVAFAVSGVLGALIAGAPIDAAVIAVHLVIAGICIALLVVFLRGVRLPYRGADRAGSRAATRSRVRRRREVTTEASGFERR